MEDSNYFLDLIKQSRRGKFKIYIGMSAGVGKTFRMLQEAHALLKNGVDIRIGYVETHKRAETESLVQGIPFIERRKILYKGKELEEMDVQTIIDLHPEVVIVDELAHTNVEGSKNEKRWQDVVDILDAGINVISAINIQHLESINSEVQRITGIAVKERVPDKVLHLANEVVNIDLTADELIARLKEGKIYDASKIETALNNFFTTDKILQLRDLALREVVSQVERKIDNEVPKHNKLRPDRFLACISSTDVTAKNIIRKTARLAAYYNSKWWVLYVQSTKENVDNIGLASQRHLINNFKMAQELGATVLKVRSEDVAKTIVEVAEKEEITTICISKPHITLFGIILNTSLFNLLLKKMTTLNIDLVILS